MPESYKLVYFAGKGRGEISRLLFAAAGVKYEDKRITFEDWPKVKPSEYIKHQMRNLLCIL